MKALVLTAGLGTRLRPFTQDKAKPALPVLGVPTFWYSVWQLAVQLGIREFALNVSHAPESVREAAADPVLLAATGARFHFSDETSGILGSSGALWKLSAWVGSQRLLVCNGDTICMPSWQRLLAFHEQKGALLTLHVRAFQGGAEPYTDIRISPDGRIEALNSKATSGVMFAGSYLLEPELLARLPAGKSELRPTLLEPLIREGRLYAYREDVDWLDTGSPRAFAEAQFELIFRMPELRKLVELKLREESPGCWVPRSWPTGSSLPKLQAPLVMLGSLMHWTAVGTAFGPRFVGLVPPEAGQTVPNSNALVCSRHVEKL